MTKIKLSSGSTTPISRAARPLDEKKSLNENTSSSVEISALPDATGLHGENLIPVVQTINGVKDTRKAKLDELVKFMPMGLPPLSVQLNGGRKTTEEMKQEYTKFLDGSYVEPISYYYSVVSSDDSVSYSQLTAYPTDGGFYVLANGVGINGNDNAVLKIVFKGDKNGFPIFVQDLELSHGDGGGIVDLPNTTDLNSVVEPGNYFVNGTDKWSNLGYPFSVAVGNKVVMSVSTVRSGKFDTVCQTFFATNLSFKPGPHARILTDAGWSIWDGIANFSYLDVNFVKTPVLEQLDLKISEAIGDRPTIYSYKKPTNDGTGPNIDFTPSANPGVVISLPWGFKSLNQGTFGGFVLALDSAGDMYVNIDMQRPNDPAAWKKFSFGDGGGKIRWDAPITQYTGNLNSLSNAGIYFNDAGTTANNWPVAGVGSVIVQMAGVSPNIFINQIVVSVDGRQRRRYSNNGGGSWTAWELIAVASDIPSRIWWNAQNVATGPALNGMTGIADQGTYQYGGAGVTIDNGFPVANVACTVSAWGGMNGIMTQVCYIPSLDAEYRRSYINKAWKPWVKSANYWSADNAVATALPDSLNTVAAQGVYQYGSTTVTIENKFPFSGRRASLMVLCGFGGGDVVQLCCDALNNNIYIRQYANSWSEWKLLGDGVKLDPNQNNLLSNSSAGLLFDRYNAPNVAVQGLNINTSYGPDFTQDNAHSEAGGVWRVKQTLMLSRVPAKYSGVLLLNIKLSHIPCDSSGIPIPYNLSFNDTSKQIGGVFRKHAVMLLAVTARPVKLMDIVTGEITDYTDQSVWTFSVGYTFGNMAPSV